MSEKIEIYRRSFKRIYPESEIHITGIDIIKDQAIISADFPDGIFYFIVSENSVSSSYNSFDEAKRHIF